MAGNTQIVKRFLLTMTILVAGLIVVALGLASPLAESLPVAANGDSVQRGIDVSAARYNALAAFYNAPKGDDVDSARYTALGRLYAQRSA